MLVLREIPWQDRGGRAFSTSSNFVGLNYVLAEEKKAAVLCSVCKVMMLVLTNGVWLANNLIVDGEQILYYMTINSEPVM